MHIYDFITDEFQYSLKEKARERPNQLPFEVVLRNYKGSFLNLITSTGLTTTENPKYLHSKLSKRPEVQKWLEEYRRIFLNEKIVIESVFNEILNIYEVFIRGKQHNAVLRLHDLLDKHGLLDEADGELLGGFFRCRWKRTDEEDAAKEVDYFYPIPYNKRYLVKNQRFSVSGIPLLYLGASLATSLYEIGQENLDHINNPAISFWGFNPAFYRYPGVDYKQPARTKIYDITNLAFDILNDTIMDLLEETDDERRENMISNLSFINRDEVRIAIRKFALSQLCTFVTEKFFSISDGKTAPVLLNGFYEEYIIPQILTEAIRLHKYDGIFYPSTKFSKVNISSNTGWLSGAFKGNLVMFCHYTSTDAYDRNLIGNYIVEVNSKKAIDIKVLNKLIIDTENDITLHEVFIRVHANHIYLAQRIRAMLRYSKKRLRLYKDLSLNGKPYSETLSGNIELQLVAEYASFVMGELRGNLYELFDPFMQEVNEGKYRFPWLNIPGQTKEVPNALQPGKATHFAIPLIITALLMLITKKRNNDQ